MKQGIEPCQCGIVSEVLEDPESGISCGEDGKFITNDPFVLHYCPRCQGQIPNFWNAVLSDEERDWLQEIIDGISSPDEAIRQLGPPDFDSFDTEYQAIDAERYNSVEVSERARNIEYYQLSLSANLEFYFGPGQARLARIVLKFVGPIENSA